MSDDHQCVEIVSTWIKFGKRSRRLKHRELRVISTGDVLLKSTSVTALKSLLAKRGCTLLNERDVTEEWQAGNPNPTITAADLKLEGLLRS